MMNKDFQDRLTRGVVLVDKQAGRTSHDEVGIIKRAYRAAGLQLKVGHSGTLDPKVTGLLVVGIGMGTKVLEYMLRSQKVYVGEIVFHQSVTRQQIQDAIKHFTGSINQLPPRKSRVKRVERVRDVYEMELLNFDEEHKTAQLRCAVEKGTYIRKLFHDMGVHLGIRAHMGELHRTHVGPFTETEGSLSADEFANLVRYTTSLNPWKRFSARKKLQTIVRPLADALVDLPTVIMSLGVEQYIATGSDLFIPGVDHIDPEAQVGDEVVVCDNNHHVCAIGTLNITPSELSTKQKGIAVKTTKVLL